LKSRSRFQVNDEYILSVGLFKARSRGAKKNVYAANENTGDDETAEERTDVGDDATDVGDGTGMEVGADEEAGPDEEAVDSEGAGTDEEAPVSDAESVASGEEDVDLAEK